jgi:hypothetical protein
MFRRHKRVPSGQTSASLGPTVHTFHLWDPLYAFFIVTSRTGICFLNQLLSTVNVSHLQELSAACVLSICPWPPEILLHQSYTLAHDEVFPPYCALNVFRILAGFIFFH